MSLVTHKFTPAAMSDVELEATFAARSHTVEYLVNSLRDQIRSGTLSSFIVTGPRGAGKSTVIHMVDLRIRQDPDLSAVWIPVLFPEEQFRISSLRDLLAETLQVLSQQRIEGASEWLERVEAERDDEQSEQLAVTALRDITRRSGKRLVLFVENLDLLFEGGLGDQMQGTLRRLIMNEPFMLLISSSVHLFDSLKSYSEPFFNYFGTVRLDRLNAEQVFELLTRRAEFDGNEDFLRSFKKERAKIRAIVELSGGNPRLVLMLYELLSQRQVTTIVQCLRQLVDELTPLLKHEVESLPVQQRKLIHVLMEKGGTATPTDLAGPMRLPLNAVTAQLKRLKNAQMVEVLGGGKGRPAHYTVPDKLFAIWYRMRYLGQSRRIEFFVEVLRIWFDEEERLQTLRSLAEADPSRSPGRGQDSATTAEYFAASLSNTKYAQEAADLSIGQWAKADLEEAAIVYTQFVGVSQARASTETAAYTGLARWLSHHGDPSHALEVLDRVLEGQGESSARVEALLDRGLLRGVRGDVGGAIADYTAVIELAGAPPEQVARALVNRGVTKGAQGDLAGRIADYTAVIELAGVPREPMARALVYRGMTKGAQGDVAGEIADYTAVIELAGVPREPMARALVYRGITKG
ncbi:MAG: AAA family ATPase, partial [Acidobacteria bacterium]|nr:AAA family ATPase [Acidobacteriota bacterium]